ncbi:hypothetical protein ACRQFN_02330 [Actinotignum sp. GS-2025e]|uniref:hypothetical protein n=1 Tax=unclassified Actinotignum TaxID=2632702 RepID=UPI003F45D476
MALTIRTRNLCVAVTGPAPGGTWTLSASFDGHSWDVARGHGNINVVDALVPLVPGRVTYTCAGQTGIYDNNPTYLGGVWVLQPVTGDDMVMVRMLDTGDAREISVDATDVMLPGRTAPYTVHSGIISPKARKLSCLSDWDAIRTLETWAQAGTPITVRPTDEDTYRLVGAMRVNLRTVHHEIFDYGPVDTILRRIDLEVMPAATPPATLVPAYRWSEVPTGRFHVWGDLKPVAWDAVEANTPY